MINIDLQNIPFKLVNHSRIIFEKYLDILNTNSKFTSDKCEFCDRHFYRSQIDTVFLDVRTYTNMNEP